MIIAFGLPALCVLALKNSDFFLSEALAFLIFGLQAMTPTLAALVVTLIVAGPQELKAFLYKLYVENLSIGWMVLAVLVPLALLTGARLIIFIFENKLPFFFPLTTKELLIAGWALIAEEVGWRGFLQEKLKPRFGSLLTPLFVGSIWALWHYHFYWLGTLAVPLGLFILTCIADSYGLYWITNKTRGNIIPASLWHFSGNLFIRLYAINPEDRNGSILPYLVYGALLALMALLIVWQKGRAPNNITSTVEPIR